MWGIFDFIEDKIKEVLDTVGKWIDDAKAWVLGEIEKALGKVKKWISDAKDWALRQINKARQEIQGWISKAKGWALQQINKASQEIKGWFSKLEKGFLDWIKEAKSALLAEISKASQSLRKTISPLISFTEKFSKEISSFFKDPWDYLWGKFPTEKFWASVAKGLEDVTGDDKDLEKAYAEIPSPFEMEKSVIDQLIGVEPEESPQILPEIQVLIALFEQETQEEMLEATKAWEKARQAILKRLAAA